MKFGRNLVRNQIPEWAPAYLNYKGLKKLIKAAAAVPEPDLAEIFFALDRNLEDVSSFYNKKFGEATRRLKLLQDHDHADELLEALLDLSRDLRNLRSFGSLNRQAFVKITKKLDKKVANVCVQQPYITSKVDTKPFATNLALEEVLDKINDMITAADGNKGSDTKSIRSVRIPANLSLPSGVLDDLDTAILQDDVALLEKALQKIDDYENLRLKLQNMLLHRSISHESRSCIAHILKDIQSLQDPDDFNQRNCLHRLVISIGRSNQSPATIATQFLTPAATPSMESSSVPRTEYFNLDTIRTLAYVLEKLQPEQRSELVAKDSSGRIPLHYAAQFGLVAVCELLVQQMQDWGQLLAKSSIDMPEWQDNDGMAPLHLSVIGGHPLTTKALLRASDGTQTAELSPKTNEILEIAVQSDFVDIVRQLVEADVDVNWQNKSGETALHVAARFGHEACATILVEGTEKQKGAIDLVENSFGWTPLHIAAVDGQVAIVDLLIAAGAELNKLDSSGWTAREHAALRGHIIIAERLADAAPFDSSSDSGESVNTAASSPPPLSASLEERRSQVSPPRTTDPVKAFGHRYLTDKSMILLSLGSMDMRKSVDAVRLDRVSLRDAHTAQLDTALSMVVSAKGAEGESTIIDLPVQDNISTEPIIFMAQDPTQVKVMFDIVPTYSGDHRQKIGRAVALLSSIRSTVGIKRMNLYGDLTIPILSSDTMDVIGTVNFNFLIITPFSHPNMGVTEKQTYWKSTSTMVIGHRGLGKNHNANRSLQLGENTIQSFIAAANLGANYVEFDVQLTKDLVPVIYHDFLVSETGIDAPVHSLTLEQFLHINGHEQRSTSPDHGRRERVPLRGQERARSMSLRGPEPDLEMDERMKHTRDFKAKGFKANSRGHFIQAPFATLEEMFKKLPEEIGFNIEMKYPMLHESEEHEMDAYAVELNSFCDTVLTKVYDLGKKRNVIFSSFNPDLCLILSFKQPSIPILFLTDAGVSPVGDIRASSLQEAIRFASRWNLLGIVSAAEPLCNSPRLVKVVKENGLVCVSYGSLNNDPKQVKLQVQEGIDAVIVDSVLKIRKGLQEHQSARPKADLKAALALTGVLDTPQSVAV